MRTRPTRRQSRLRIPEWGIRVWVGLGILAITLIVAALAIIPSGNVAIAPNKPIDLRSRLKIDNRVASPPNGHIYLVGVSERPVSILSEQLLKLDETVTLQPDVASSHRKEVRQADRDEIRQSKKLAAAAAYRLLGEKVVISGEGAPVVGVDPKGPSAGALQLADRVVALQGDPVRTSLDVTRVVKRARPGTKLNFRVRRGGRTVDVPVVTAAPTADTPGQKSRVGLLLDTKNLSIQVPHDVSLRTGSIVGPSAGLAFALATYDAESEEDMMRTRKVVASGALTLDGDVMPVGGIKQKAISLRGGGYDLFLVPTGNLKEARDAIREHCPDRSRCPRVMGVTSVADALRVLRSGYTQFGRELPPPGQRIQSPQR